MSLVQTIKSLNPGYMLTEEEFQNLLSQERSRRDRSGSEFALILFKTEEKKYHKGYAARLIRAMFSRKRSIDELGWYDQERIGVILPSTNQEGARKFASDIENKTRSRYAYPLVSISAYSG